MRSKARILCAKLGWHLRALPMPGRSPLVTLLYHGTPISPSHHGIAADDFEKHILLLRREFEFVSADRAQEIGTARKTAILLTFDDGFRNNAEYAVPVLQRYGIPATFFISTRHIEEGKYLWFTYLRALKRHYHFDWLTFRGEKLDMRRAQRAATVEKLQQLLFSLHPHPQHMYDVIERELPPLEAFTSASIIADHYAGMSREQLAAIAAQDLFTIGGHTIDHPMLTKCDPAEAVRQMRQGASELERITGTPCRLFAYPGVDYNRMIMTACKECSFEAAFSAERQIEGETGFQIPRVGVYYPSPKEAGFKVRWSQVLQKRRA